ncbi:MAG: pirin family protein [Bdellovibrionota bacterium]
MPSSQKTIHLAETRGHADHGWLKSHHTFSFADYHDPSRMNFGTLRVLNDDVILGGSGFGTHPHRDMEIISIPIGGALAHKDSVGNSGGIRHGEVQVMSAGTGIAHSEFNGSETEEAKLLQIWVMPKKIGVTPRYDQKKFEMNERNNEFQLVVSPDGREGSLSINQDAFFSLANLQEDRTLSYKRRKDGNGLYVFLIDGEIEVAGEDMRKRDGIGLRDINEVTIKAKADSEILVIEVPMA